MRILVVSQYYYPENFRINDICAELSARGHEVHVLTGLPNYPAGEYFPGYSRQGPFEQQHQGVSIHRVPMRARGKGKVSLVLNYLSFWRQGKKAAARMAQLGFDVVFVYEVSPITQVLPAIKVKRLAGIPLLTYMTDLWPENVQYAGGINSRLVLAPIGWMADHIYRNCDQILTSSHSFKKAIAQRGHPEEKIHFWPQYAEDFYRPGEKDAEADISLPQGFRLMFTGNMGYSQGLDVLIEAAALLDMPDLRIILVGGGRAEQSLRELVHSRGLANRVYFHEAIPAESVPGMLACADAAVLMIRDTPAFAMTLPAKLQSYFACGIPVLGSIAGEAADVLAQSGGGMACKPSDAEAFARLVCGFRALPDEDKQAMGQRARQFFLDNYDRKKLIDDLERRLKSLAGIECKGE